MTLEATRMALKAKLANKGRLRPHEMICKKMPDCTGSLQDLPMRAHGAAAEDEAADGEYCKAIDRVTAVFGKEFLARVFPYTIAHRPPSRAASLIGARPTSGDVHH